MAELIRPAVMDPVLDQRIEDEAIFMVLLRSIKDPYSPEFSERYFSPSLHNLYIKTKQGLWKELTDLIESAKEFNVVQLIYVASHFNWIGQARTTRWTLEQTSEQIRQLVINHLYESSLRLLISHHDSTSSLDFVRNNNKLEKMIAEMDDDNHPHVLDSCMRTKYFLENVVNNSYVRLEFFLNPECKNTVEKLIKLVKMRIKRLQHDTIQSESKTLLVGNPENYADEHMQDW